MIAFHARLAARSAIAEQLRELADRVEETGDGVSIVCLLGPDRSASDVDLPAVAYVHSPDAFHAIMSAAEYLTRLVDDVPSSASSL